MSQFISYAQNFEDVMLWRALKDIEHGFYIDLGAWSPDLDSVTKAFYERGWRGINVEPNPEFHAQLMEKRLHDINLQVAISNKEGKADIQVLPNTGLSTLDLSIAERHESAGWSRSQITIPLTTLSALWKKHVPTGQAVHFLKIDVEGSEEDIIRSTDWTSLRPWVIVVEATVPMSQVETHARWQECITEADYQLVYADGLNRYYLAAEHSDRKASFQYPPNVFDDFIRADLVQQIMKCEGLEEGIAKMRQSLQEARLRTEKESERANRLETQCAEAKAQHAEELAKLQAEKNDLQARLNQSLSDIHRWWLTATTHEKTLQAIKSSWSWRITRPLRTASSLLRWLLMLPICLLTPILAPILRWLMGFVLNRPKLRQAASTVLQKTPKIYWALFRSGQTAGLPVTGLPTAAFQARTPQADALKRSESPEPDLSHLTPRARQIYADLKAAIKTHQSKSQGQ